MRPGLLLALVATLVGTSVLVRARVGSVPSDVAVERPRGPDASSSPIAGISTAAGEPPARPRSLRGTRTDGGLVVDAAGRFAPTIDARRLFDYFLTAAGEVPDETIRARIVREIGRRLAPDAARDATALLDRYLAYRERVRLLAAEGPQDDGDLERRFATLLALRREMLGLAAADAFFAGEEAEARRLLDVRRITSDPALSVEERARRVEAVYERLDADLPDDVREARAATRLASRLRAAEAEVREHGGGPDDVQALRERLAGPEAAARLADLDRRRADWAARVESYRSARARIEDDPSLAPAARAAAVERLLAQGFTPSERLRVEALDRIAAASRPPSP